MVAREVRALATATLAAILPRAPRAFLAATLGVDNFDMVLASWCYGGLSSALGLLAQALLCRINGEDLMILMRASTERSSKPQVGLPQTQGPIPWVPERASELWAQG